jgi:hypothetical protein
MTDTEHDRKTLALAAHLKVSPDTISECRHGDNQYECDAEPGEYLVLTDSEADAAFKVSVENFIDECVLLGFPAQYIGYFNSEAYIRDVELGDGRGPSLASYDGAEQEQQVDGVWYYIYRVN